jgi:hypothetical protein
MSCSRVQSELSGYLDNELSGAHLHAMSAHLESCLECARRLEELRFVSESVASLPLLSSPEPLAARVLDRVEVESRGPGLALLFRSARAARPLMFPSVVPAAMILVCTLSSVLMLGARDLRSYNEASHGRGQAWERFHATGTNADPLSPGAGSSAPETAADIFMDYQLALVPSRSLFIETVVDRDGRVLNVTLLEGDSQRAAPILNEMRYQRYRPGLGEDGSPVTMRAYRLFDSVEVRAPLT